MRKTTAAVTATIAAVCLSTFAALPDPAVLLDGATLDKPLRGAFHVHTSRSDGSGTVEQVAAAAARAGLDFVVLTDHGDATRLPASPVYHSGVLCIDAVEVSTSGGHVVALGMDDRSPYPLGGEPRDVVDDIQRQGGMAIATHPDSSKDALRWTDWQTPLDGVEWLNADSEWRDEHPVALARALLTYPWRKAETLAAMVDRRTSIAERWLDVARHRRVVILAGADAHANLGLGTSHPYGDQSWLAIPAYEQSFRTFSIALPDTTLTRNPYADAAAVVDAIRAGRVYASLDGFAGPPRFTMTATSGSTTVVQGGELAPTGPVRFLIRSNAPDSATTVLYRDAAAVAQSSGSTLEYVAPSQTGVYRAEVALAGRQRTPWIVSNPIYVGRPAAPTSKPAALREAHVVYDDGPVGRDWTVRKSGQALAELDVTTTLTGTRVRLRYGLAGSTAGNTYLAMDIPAGTGLERFDRVVFLGQADKPMRVWFQLWMRTADGDAAWRRSVYLDETEREITIPLADLVADSGTSPAPPLASITSLMFVVDQTHTPLGRSGTFWIDALRYVR